MSLLISIEQARAEGLRWYFTGQPCPRGHIAKRSLSNRFCRACEDANSARRRAENPEPFRARDRARQDDKRREQRRESWARHRESQLAQDRARHAAAPERKREQADAWWRANRERKYAYVAQRKKQIIRATPSWLTAEQRAEINALYLEAQRRPGEWHVDHIIPLRGKGVCGLHVPWNLQLLQGDENRRKGVRYAPA